MPSRPLQIAVITGACLGTYFVLRSLPVESCEFLHYADYVNSEGVIEGCGYEETEFFDLNKLRFPILAEVSSLDDLVPGRTAQCKLTLFTTTGRPIEWDQIAVSHTERVHAMIVDASLGDYHHLHPQPAGPAGHYYFDFTPAKPGPYRVYLDFIPLINNRRTLLQSTIEVAGEPRNSRLAPSRRHETERFEFAFLPREAPLNLEPGKEYTFDLKVSSKNGKAFEFGEVMGAFAHIVAFDETRRGFAHLHPLNPYPNTKTPSRQDLAFALQFDQAGDYRVYAQVVLDEEEYFIPFTIRVGTNALAAK